MTRTLTIIIVTAIALLVASGARGQTTQPSRLILAWTPSLGGPAEYRGLDPLIVEKGWGAWIEKNIIPELHWLKAVPSEQRKQDRIILHMPDGRGQAPGEQYYLSEFYRLQKFAPHLTETATFVDAWRPVIDAGVEVIWYSGYFEHDPYFAELWKTNRAQWATRILRAYERPIAAGMSIAIDASSGINEGSPSYYVVKLLQAHGVTVYIETITDRQHWDGLPMIALDATYENFIRGKHEPKRSEQIIWCQQPWEGPFSREWADRMVRKYQTEGKTVIIPAGWLRHGVPNRGEYQ